MCGLEIARTPRHRNTEMNRTDQPLGTYDVLLFDGDCGICTKSAELAQRIAARSGYQVRPYQAIPESELIRLGTSYERCGHRIHSVTRDGRVYRGAFSVNHFLWRHMPWRLIPLMLYILFPLVLLEVGLYALIAANRLRISRWFGLTACAIPKR